VGGLSVLREIRKELPHEDLIYVADSGHVPYGDKPFQQIKERAVSITEFLMRQSAKAIVVACNTATGAAIETLRARFQMPIVGMEPAVKPAVGKSRSKSIGVLATTATLTSDRFASLVERFGAGVKVCIEACPGLVEKVEAADISDAATRALLEKHVSPLMERGVDIIVLGCTHYSFLAPIIQELAGPDVTILDPCAAVARELRRRLEAGAALSSSRETGREIFWTSGPLDASNRVISELWRSRVEVRRLPQ
jgi:glutamate racemase